MTGIRRRSRRRPSSRGRTRSPCAGPAAPSISTRTRARRSTGASKANGPSPTLRSTRRPGRCWGVVGCGVGGVGVGVGGVGGGWVVVVVWGGCVGGGGVGGGGGGGGGG